MDGVVARKNAYRRGHGDVKLHTQPLDVGEDDEALQVIEVESNRKI